MALPADALVLFELAFQKHHGYWSHLRSAADKFFAHQKRFIADLRGAAADDDPDGPVSHELNALSTSGMENVRRMMSLRHTPLVMLGANSSGKSTLINALLRARVAPTGSGHVTARICRFSYEPQATAYVCLSRLDQNSCLQEEPNSRRSVAAETDGDKLCEHFWSLIRRDAAPSEDAPEYASWVQVIVEVHWPFELLKPGFDLYDAPGTSTTDNAAVQSHLGEFIAVVRPTPLFIFMNPALSDSEMGSLRVLHERLVSNRDQPPHVLLISNGLDVDTLFNEYQWCTEEPEVLRRAAETELNRRYEMVRSRQELAFMGLANYPDGLHCPFFASVSGLDVLMRNFGWEFTYPLLIDRLRAFCTLVNHQRLINSARQLLQGTKVLFNDITTLRTTSVESIVASKLEAEAALKELELRLNARLLAVVKSVPALIRAQVKRAELLIVEKAESLLIPPFDGMYIDSEINMQAYGALRDRLRPFIQMAVFSVVFANLRHQISQVVQDLTCDWLVDTTRQAAAAREIVTDALFAQTPLFTPEGFSFARSVASFLNVVTIPKAIFKWMYGKAGCVDRDWKRVAAGKVLEEVTALSVDRGNDPFTQKLLEWAGAVIGDLRNEINRRASRAEQLTQLVRTNNVKMQEYELLFGQVEVETLAVQCEMEEPEPPLVDQSASGIVAENALATLRRGTWKGKAVFVSSPKLTNNGPNNASDRRAMLCFCEEVHSSYLMRNATAPAGEQQADHRRRTMSLGASRRLPLQPTSAFTGLPFLNFVSLYRKNVQVAALQEPPPQCRSLGVSNSSLLDSAWQVVYLAPDLSLQDMLSGVDEHNKLDLRLAYRAMRTVLRILSELHSRGIVHRQINPRNVWYSRQTDEFVVSWLTACTTVRTKSNEDLLSQQEDPTALLTYQKSGDLEAFLEIARSLREALRSTCKKQEIDCLENFALHCKGVKKASDALTELGRLKGALGIRKSDHTHDFISVRVSCTVVVPSGVADFVISNETTIPRLKAMVCEAFHVLSLDSLELVWGSRVLEGGTALACGLLPHAHLVLRNSHAAAHTS